MSNAAKRFTGEIGIHYPLHVLNRYSLPELIGLAESGGAGPSWATVADGPVRFGILGKVGSPWVQLSGEYYSPDGIIRAVVRNFDNHAWVPASAIHGEAATPE